MCFSFFTPSFNIFLIHEFKDQYFLTPLCMESDVTEIYYYGTVSLEILQTFLYPH